jgi:hypothetical protein
MTFAPAMASFALKPHHHKGHERLLTALQNSYRGLLARSMRKRWLTVGAALVAVTMAVGSIKFLGTEFMPQLDEGALLIETRRLPSVSLTQSVEIATMVEKVVREFPEVETVVTKIGRPDLATEAMGVYQGDVYVILKPKEQWTTVRTKEELIEKLDGKLKDAPGVVYNFTQPLAMRLDEVISGVKADVAVKLFGDDPATLEREARKIENILRRVRGSADVQTETLGGAGELQIAVNRAEMARYGLRVEDLKGLIETAIGGGAATEVIDGRRRFDVVVRLPETRRREIETIRAARSDARRRAGNARTGRRHSHRRRPGGHQPRRRSAPHRHSIERARARHRRFCGRGSKLDRARSDAAGRLLHHVGRRIREHAAGDAEALRRRAAGSAADLSAALFDVQLAHVRRADHRQRAVRPGRRSRGGMAARDESQSFDGGRLHCALRRGRAQRRGDG